MSLQESLIDAMAEMVNPTKKATATVQTAKGSYQYEYEKLNDVLGCIRPVLAKHKLAFTQGQKFDPDLNTFVLETVVFDKDERMVMDVRPMPAFNQAQPAGSWETYMRRYALRTAFGLAGEDDDGAAATSTPAATQSRTTPANRNGGTSTPTASKQIVSAAEKRQKMINAALDLMNQCVNNGVKASGLAEYAMSNYGEESLDKLTDDQLIDYGRYLRQMATDSKTLKEN